MFITVYQDGTGYDLRKLLGSNKFLTFINGNLNQIYYSPCETTDLPDNIKNLPVNECKNGYTLCLYDISTDSAFILGTSKNTSFSKSASEEMFVKFGSTKYD